MRTTHGDAGIWIALLDDPRQFHRAVRPGSDTGEPEYIRRSRGVPDNQSLQAGEAEPSDLLVVDDSRLAVREQVCAGDADPHRDAGGDIVLEEAGTLATQVDQDHDARFARKGKNSKSTTRLYNGCVAIISIELNAADAAAATPHRPSSKASTFHGDASKRSITASGGNGRSVAL